MKPIAARASRGARRILGRGLARVVFAVGAMGTAVAVASISLVPKLAAACAVCTSGRDDESNTAFLISTIFLSLLPLAALGTLVFVLWRRIRRLEGEPAGTAGLPVPTASTASIPSPTTSSITSPIAPTPAH